MIDPTTRDVPPRGLLFAVQHASHVIHNAQLPVTNVIGTRRYEVRAHALAALREIDSRLDPRIVCIDKE